MSCGTTGPTLTEDSSEAVEAEARSERSAACAFFATKELPAIAKTRLQALPKVPEGATPEDVMTPDQLALHSLLNREVERDVAHEQYCKET